MAVFFTIPNQHPVRVLDQTEHTSDIRHRGGDFARYTYNTERSTN
jgi:hypothetical protein